MPNNISKQQPVGKPVPGSPAYNTSWLLPALVVLILIASVPLILSYLRVGTDVVVIVFLLSSVIAIVLTGYIFLKMWNPWKELIKARHYFFVIYFVLFIIAVVLFVAAILTVLGVLFTVGVFNSPSFPAAVSSSSLPQCLVLAHISGGVLAYSCSNLTLSTGGAISLNLLHNIDFNYYNLRIACTNSTENVPTGSEVMPSAYPKWSYLTSTGSLSSTYDPSNSYTLPPRKEIQIKGLPCYKTADEPLGNIPEGTIFNGTIWISYTPSPGPENNSNFSQDWVNDLFATIIVNATTQ